MSNLAVDFESVWPLIRSLAKRYEWVDDRTELEQELSLMVVEEYPYFDPDRSDFAGFVYRKSIWYLTDLARRKVITFAELPTSVPDKHPHYNLVGLLSNLSYDAKLAVIIATDLPADVEEEARRNGGGDCNYSAALFRHLQKSFGWSVGRIRETFGEVRKAIQ